MKENKSLISQCKPWDIRDISWSKIAGSVASDGVYLKAEKIIDDKKHYLKLSNYDSYRGIFGHESVNELIAYRLGKILGFNVTKGVLKKALVKVEGIEYEAYVYIAESFKVNESRSSFEEYYRSKRLSGKESPLDFCIRQGWSDDIFKMFIFDFLIINRDRHGANLEVLKNASKKLSPLYDNGVSFVCANTDAATVCSFDVVEDRPANNFIGERSLEKNINFIDSMQFFNELKEEHKTVLFKDLCGVLDPVYFDKIWEILTKRWEYVKKFRIT